MQPIAGEQTANNQIEMIVYLKPDLSRESGPFIVLFVYLCMVQTDTQVNVTPD